MDFCLLLYISEYAGKTMEDCNVMIIEMGKNSDSVSDNDYSSDGKTQLHLNFQKKIYQLLGASCPFFFLEHVCQKYTVFGSFCVFQGIFRPAS